MIEVRHGSAAHWALRAAGAVAVAFLVWYVPATQEAGSIGDVTRALELAIAAMSLNLVAGYTGQISFGHSAFFGIGAYTTAILVAHYGWTPGWSLVPAAVVAFVVGFVVGFPALRLRGLHLALMTMALAVLFPQLVKWQKLSWLTDGARGISNVSYRDLPDWPFLGELVGRHGRAVFAYWLTILALVGCFLVCRGLVRSRIGRALIAIRDNELAASVMGIDVARTKTTIFGISASMCAIAGSLATLRTTLVSTEVVSLTVMGGVTFLLVVILGGAGTLWGPIVGALGYVTIDLWSKDAAGEGGILEAAFGWMGTSPATLVLAMVLVAMMFAAPFGVTGLVQRLARRVLVVVPAPLSAEAAPPAPAVPERLDDVPTSATVRTELT